MRLFGVSVAIVSLGTVLSLGTFSGTPAAGAEPAGGATTNSASVSAGKPALAAPAAGALQAPVTTGAPSGGSLPAGHPDFSSLPGGQMSARMAGKMAQPKGTGKLYIHVVQGTPGGPAIGPDSVTVDFYREGEVVGRVQNTLDKNGRMLVTDLPVQIGIQPLIRVTHGGVEFMTVGDVMDPKMASPEITVKVFETTDKAPDWHLKMRHLLLQGGGSAVHVVEMLAIENPGDRAWTGTAQADGSRVVFAWPLPAGATDIHLDGAFDENRTKLADNAVVNSAALVPGVSQFQIQYTVPAADGKVLLSTAAPVAVKQMMVLVPDDGSTVKADGLTLMTTADMGNGRTRMYRTGDLPAGKAVSVALANLPAAAPAEAAAAAAPAEVPAGMMPGQASAAPRTTGSSSSSIAQGIAAAGGLVVLLVGGLLLFMRSPNKHCKRCDE